MKYILVFLVGLVGIFSYSVYSSPCDRFPEQHLCDPSITEDAVCDQRQIITKEPNYRYSIKCKLPDFSNTSVQIIYDSKDHLSGIMNKKLGKKCAYTNKSCYKYYKCKLIRGLCNID